MSKTLENKIYRQTQDLEDLLNDVKELLKQNYEVILKKSPYFSAYQMTAEKNPINDESERLEDIAIAFGSPLAPEEFREEIGKILERSSKYKGIFTSHDTF